MRFGILFLTGALFTTALSGCLEDEADGPNAPDPGSMIQISPEWAEIGIPFGEGHDHYNPAHHQGISTPNFQSLGWNPLVSEYYGATGGGHLCGHAIDTGERRLAVVHGLGTDIAFVLVDVTDATNPQYLGELAIPAVGSRDVALTPDGRFVAIGSSGSRLVPAVPPPIGTDATPGPPEWRSPCNPGPVPLGDPNGVFTEDNTPYQPGVILVDIQNPSQPEVVSHYPLGSGSHSINTGKIGDMTIVVSSVVGTSANSATSIFYFFEVSETPAGPELILLSAYQDPVTEGGSPIINGHNDAWLAVHPGTGENLAYLANWNQGLVILNVDDPRAPEQIGRWTDYVAGPQNDIGDDMTGQVHSALPLDVLWNDKHYTIIGQEILNHPAERPTGRATVLDTTDPSSPTKVADWTLPVDVQWDEPLVFSTHYISRVDDTLFVTLYHGGVWAVDMSVVRDGADKLPSIGVFVPANVSPKPPQNLSYDWTPTIMDAPSLPNGDLVVWDATSGVYMVRFDATNPAPALLPWDAQ